MRDVAIEVRGSRQALRRDDRARRHRPGRAHRQRARPARAQRCREDHGRSGAGDPAAARRRAGHGRRVRRGPRGPPGPPAHRAHRPVRLGRRGADGRRRTCCSSAGCWACRNRRPRRGPGSCWPSSTWPRRPSGRRRPTPAACAGGWISPRASSAGPVCCTWTSPRPAWTRAGAASCGRSSAAWSPTGVTVLLTTQYLDEADQLADDIVVIDHGRVIATGTPGRAQGEDRRPDAGGAPGRSGRSRRPWCRPSPS